MIVTDFYFASSVFPEIFAGANDRYPSGGGEMFAVLFLR